ncbi:hypothetical protein B0H13DRAFT_1914921 [Mycena leptocephala]|nr:hypothetical protein B0H13DRAFT_1914921 [Mycena leptocephala]
MTNCGAINGRPQIVELGPEFIHPERNIPIYAYHPTTPVDQPPELCGELVNGRPTPTYALAWVCPPRTFYENLGGKLGKVNDRNFTNIVSEQWGRPEFEYDLTILDCFPT